MSVATPKIVRKIAVLVQIERLLRPATRECRHHGRENRPDGVDSPFHRSTLGGWYPGCALVSRWCRVPCRQRTNADKNYWTPPVHTVCSLAVLAFRALAPPNENSADQGIDSAVVKLLKIYAMRKSSVTGNVTLDCPSHLFHAF